MNFFRHPFKYYKSLENRIKRNQKAFRVYSVLRILVIVTLVRCILTGNYESAALCILSLILLVIPTFMEEKLHVEVSASMQVIIYLFIYAAEILGEINQFYTRIHGWDTMLHTLNGFLCAAIGYSLVDLLNRSSQNIELSPFYVSLMAFCFSMTIGVCWEFFEFGADMFLGLDMQKDFIVKSIASVTLDPTNSQIPVQVSNITKTVIYPASGEAVTINGGYLDIGIIDTMKDLLVNFVGAITFSLLGYFHQKSYVAKRLTDRLTVKVARDSGEE